MLQGDLTRDRPPVLLRTLLHSTGDGLSHVDFPGYDDAQRPRWDGSDAGVQRTQSNNLIVGELVVPRCNIEDSNPMNETITPLFTVRS